MAAIRLDEKANKIESKLFTYLMYITVTISSTKSRELGSSTDPPTSSTYEEVLFNGHSWIF